MPNERRKERRIVPTGRRLLPLIFTKERRPRCSGRSDAEDRVDALVRREVHRVLAAAKQPRRRTDQGDLAVVNPQDSAFPQAEDRRGIFLVELANAIVACLAKVLDELN